MGSSLERRVSVAQTQLGAFLYRAHVFPLAMKDKSPHAADEPKARPQAVNAAQLQQTIADLGRNLTASGVLLQQALAERLGLSATESRCLDIIQRLESSAVVTPSVLVEQLGLTSGAVTGVLDRLEAARFIRREKSATDRRQIVVRTTADRQSEMRAVYEPYAKAFRELISHYEPTELLVIGRFVRETYELVERYANELRSEQPTIALNGPSGVHELSVPIGEQRSASLQVTRGVSGLELTSCEPTQLYHLSTDGPLPELVLQHDALRFVQKRASLFDFKRHRLGLGLNPDIAWSIHVRGGLSHARLALDELWLGSLEVSGGVSSVELRLSAPRGHVRLRIKGGVSQLSITRATGAQLGAIIHSGASQLVLDSLQLGAVGGRMEWQTQNFANAADRFELEVMGGAEKLHVTER